MPCFRICKVDSDYNGMEKARKWWEDWDLRILVLYIFIAQLCFLFFGRLRRKNASPLMMIMSVWLVYLFADLLATIALGKLSKIKVDEKDTGEHALRVLWAPLILFYLGGPDTLTVLRMEENKLWLRHLIGLLMQGVRAAYVLIVTWNMEKLSLLALLVFVLGIIKYGERVWIIRSRSKSNYKGFVQLELSTIDNFSGLGSNAELVLRAYSWWQTLMPHNPAYKCDSKNLSILVTKFHKSVREGTVDAFKLIEIELGLIYDMFFSKVGTIFTLWGSILRFLSFSLIVFVLVIFLKCDKPPGHLEDDHPITIILLAGAIFLEIAGVIVQLVSDWAMVWVCKNLYTVNKTSSFDIQDTGSSPVRDSSSKWATSFLFLHEYLISKRQRWSGVIGQFNIQVFERMYKSTLCNKTWECLFSREKMLKRFSSQLSPDQHLKDLIINHLREKSKGLDTLQTPIERPASVDTPQTSTQKYANVDTVQTSSEKDADVSTSQTSTKKNDVNIVPTSPKKVANVDKVPILDVTRGAWTLSKYNLKQLNWSINLEFDRSIAIWHVATQLCYACPENIGKNDEWEAVKILSNYMMYLLVVCPDTFPFCNNYDDITKELFGEGFTSSKSEGVETLKNEAKKLVEDLKGNLNIWEIVGSLWVEMLCYAAKKCPVKNHIQELRHGGEFLTHIWLLLMHFGDPKIRESYRSREKDEQESAIKTGVSIPGEIQGNNEERDEDDQECHVVENLE